MVDKKKLDAIQCQIDRWGGILLTNQSEWYMMNDHEREVYNTTTRLFIRNIEEILEDESE